MNVPSGDSKALMHQLQKIEMENESMKGMVEADKVCRVCYCDPVLFGCCLAWRNVAKYADL